MSQEPEYEGTANITARGVVIGLLTPAIATVVAFPIAPTRPEISIAVFMLAVVIAAVAGGLWSGLIAGILASTIRPLVVESPQLTFRFDDVEDVATGVVFLSVALVVGLLVGQASEDRARASRREREARFLGTLSSTLHTREVPDRVLDEFAAVLMEPFGLSRVEIEASLDGTDVRAIARTDGELLSGGPRTSVRLLAGDASIGTLVAERPAGGRPFSRDDQLLLETAARQATAALDRARLDARARNAQLDAETNQLRAAMFSSVTHDLRTPLASIKAGVTSLLDTAVRHDPTQERELLTTILEETDRLNRLVGNLLDLARIRAGALTPTRQQGAMDEIVEVVLARMRSRLAGHVVTADLPPSLPDVWVDPVQLDQVLTNLLENAGRHAPLGSEIQVSVLWLHGAVQVRVADEGPGIPLDERDRVFEAFYRGSSIPETPGSGLGLAIAKAVVVAHGGRIWIEDSPQGGCVVAFEIPGDGEQA
ncbi:MAG TPA: ATP-binding protein [Actinomycetota bacterium]|nr:ATP-binding protein [Actinomycetota bacterium]